MSKSLIVLGAGGHAKVVISTAHALGYAVSALYDDAPEKQGTTILGAPVMGSIEQFAENDDPKVMYFIAVGDNRARKRIYSRKPNASWATLIHPHAWIHSSVKIASGTLVCAGVVIQPDAVIGQHCIINTTASVDHDCSLSDFVHIGPGARLTGGVKVEEGSLLGAGCVVLPGVCVGAWSVVGAGAVVLDDVPSGVIVAGVPARIISEHSL
ncbi:MAG: acetyltransferase [Fimbriimonadales bacterium]